MKTRLEIPYTNQLATFSPSRSLKRVTMKWKELKVRNESSDTRRRIGDKNC